MLRGIEASHWPRIDQVAMEVENARLAAEITALLEGHGFVVRSWASDDMATLLPTSQVRQLLAKRHRGSERLCDAAAPRAAAAPHAAERPQQRRPGSKRRQAASPR